MNQSQKAASSLTALVCAAFFLVSILFVHADTETLSFVSDTLSQYALEKHGIVLEIGFVAIGATQILLALILFSHTGNQADPAASCFMLAGIGVIAVAIFPTIPTPAAITERLPHILGAIMQFMFFPLAVFLFSRKLGYSRYMIYTTVTGMVTAILFVVMLVLFLSPAMSDFAYFGLIEKIDIFIINIWLILTSSMVYQSKLAIN